MARIQEVSGGSGYMSQNSLVLHFGLGSSTVTDSVTIRWPSGVVESYLTLVADRKYTMTELSVTAVDDVPESVAPFQLEAPTPNPSPGRVGLSFVLPRAAHARLSIFDVTGRLVTTLVDKDLPAGRYPLLWTHRNSEGARVASGVYLAKLEALGEVRLRKLTLIR
jgi:hypothetical protein